MTFTWTPEAIAQAAALYGKGTHSAAQIGEMLGTSKGSVIGKMSRAGIVAVRTTCDAPPKPSVERKGPAKALYPVGDIPAPIAPAMPQRRSWGTARRLWSYPRASAGIPCAKSPVRTAFAPRRPSQMKATAPHVALSPTRHPARSSGWGIRRCGGLGDVRTLCAPFLRALQLALDGFPHKLRTIFGFSENSSYARKRAFGQRRQHLLGKFRFAGHAGNLLRIFLCMSINSSVDIERYIG
jgi:hypothetical protein